MEYGTGEGIRCGQRIQGGIVHGAEQLGGHLVAILVFQSYLILLGTSRFRLVAEGKEVKIYFLMGIRNIYAQRLLISVVVLYRKGVE